jgi:hypothetical protein
MGFFVCEKEEGKQKNYILTQNINKSNVLYFRCKYHKINKYNAMHTKQ